MHADNDYCRRGRTMMHGGGGSVSQKVYLCGGLYCERRNKIVKRKRRNGFILSFESNALVYLSRHNDPTRRYLEEIRLAVINITTCTSNAWNDSMERRWSTFASVNPVLLYQPIVHYHRDRNRGRLLTRASAFETFVETPLWCIP